MALADEASRTAVGVEGRRDEALAGPDSGSDKRFDQLWQAEAAR